MLRNSSPVHDDGNRELSLLQPRLRASQHLQDQEGTLKQRRTAARRAPASKPQPMQRHPTMSHTTTRTHACTHQIARHAPGKDKTI